MTIVVKEGSQGKMFKSIFLCCFVASFVASAIACNGCSIKKAMLKPCPGSEKSNVLQLRLDSILLGEDCVARPKGSLEVTKALRELETKWSFKKGALNKNGESDGCKELAKAAEDKEAGTFLRLFGLPKKCPISKGNTKINNEVDLSKYKDKMKLLAGASSGKVDISHGKDGKSCYTFEAVVDCKSA